MTDRHAGYLVTLSHDIRDDDAEGIISALHHLKGVVSVDPVLSSVGISIAKSRADSEWRSRILRLLDDTRDD